MNRGTPLDNNVLHGATVANGRFWLKGRQKIIVSYVCTYTLSLSFSPLGKRTTIQYTTLPKS